MRLNNTRVIGSALFLVSILLSACGGGGGSSGGNAPASSTLSGVAAVGTPIVNGTINVTCAAGGAPASTTTSSTGTWSVTLSGQSLPCAVQVSGGTINAVANTTPYHSLAIVSGIVNVSPLTDLMVANLAGTPTPNSWFAGLSATPASLSTLTQIQVNASLATLSAALPALTPLGVTNPITTAFTPLSGNVSDDMLTALGVAIANNGSGVTYLSLLGNVSTATVVLPTGLGTALTLAYSGTQSGGNKNGTANAVLGPGITGVLPASAAPGTMVTISGTNFAQVAGNLFSGGAYQISFNGIKATPFMRTLTQLAVVVPTGATTGPLTVTDLTTNLVYTVPGIFTVNTTTNLNPARLIGGNNQGNSLALAGITSIAASGLTNPGHITTDGTNIYLTDTGVVLKVAPSTGVVTTVLGAPRTCTVALCNAFGITTDGTNLYVVDGAGTVFNIVIATGVSTVLASGLQLAGGGGAMTTDGSNLYISENVGIRKIAISAVPITSWGATSVLNTIPSVHDMTTDGTNLYFINGNAIQKADIATGTVTNLAGSVGIVGSADGIGGLATFRMLWALATDGVNLYATQQNGGIRKIVIATGAVTTLSTASATGVTTDGNALFYASPNVTLNKMQ